MRKYLTRPILISGGAGLCLLLSYLPKLHFLVFVSIFLGAVESVPEALKTLSRRSLDVEILMLLAALGSMLLGRPAEAAILLFLFALSKALENLTLAKTKNAIDGLVRLRPSRVTVRRDGTDQEVLVEEVVLDDIVLLPAFTSAAVDGVVLEGKGSIDTSALTGESAPVFVEPGVPVMAGVRNLEFELLLRATSTVENSTLQKVVDLVEEARDNRASGERISHWFGERYTWFVLISSLLMMLVKLFLAVPFHQAAYSALTLLVALSPCALVISVPAATLSAMGWAARNGILIRGGEYIEKAGQIDAIVFDKTGTLTLGRPELVEICLCDLDTESSCDVADVCWGGGEMSAEARQMLLLSASAEAQSEHPVAHALLRKVRELGLVLERAEEVETIPGLGIRATVNGKKVQIGQLKMMTGELPRGFLDHVESIQSRGWTVAVVSVDGNYAALGFEDQPKLEAKSTIEKLRSLGIEEQWMLTGDNFRTAESIVQKVGLTNFAADLMPGDKVEALQRLQKTHKVMMVGDGINDAPALMASDVGIAMGGLGSDIALNSADIVLMKDRISALPQIVSLGRKTNTIVKMNLLLGGVVIACLAFGSLVGILPLPLAVIGHEGSTLLVILNGLRLLAGPKL